jgi:hypothetical protein
VKGETGSAIAYSTADESPAMKAGLVYLSWVAIENGALRAAAWIRGCVRSQTDSHASGQGNRDATSRARA